MNGSTNTGPSAVAVFLALAALSGVSSAAEITVYPLITADGTLMDSNLADGVDAADTAAWGFNEYAPFAGALALIIPDGVDVGFERRVFWEYDLKNVSYSPPVSARLNYRLRGAPIWACPPVEVHVYSYAADLVAELSDYDVQPATLQGSITVLSSYFDGEGISVGSLNVTQAVTQALESGADAVGFRFQIDPFTPNPRNGAFDDAVDEDQTTKPSLTITDVMQFDTDEDDDVDSFDYLLFSSCLHGPDTPLSLACREFDANFDNHVDLADFAILQRQFTSQP